MNSLNVTSVEKAYERKEEIAVNHQKKKHGPKHAKINEVYSKQTNTRRSGQQMFCQIGTHKNFASSQKNIELPIESEFVKKETTT